MPPAHDLTVREGLRLYSPEAVFIRVPEAFYTRCPVEARMALSQIRDASDVLGRLLDGGHSAVAGRLAGAFRRIGRGDVAGEILSAMKAAGYDVRETDPFEAQYVFETKSRSVAPIVGRIRTYWASMRSTVIDVFPEAPGLPKDRDAYMGFVDGIYPQLNSPSWRPSLSAPRCSRATSLNQNVFRKLSIANNQIRKNSFRYDPDHMQKASFLPY